MTEFKKMNKKAQKAENAKRRITWETTFGRSMPHSYAKKNGKAYTRKQKHKNAWI